MYVKDVENKISKLLKISNEVEVQIYTKTKDVIHCDDNANDGTMACVCIHYKVSGDGDVCKVSFNQSERQLVIIDQSQA